MLAQRATTKQWLHWDLPLTIDETNWALSSPGHLSGTIDPEIGSMLADDGALLLDEWGTLLYIEDGGAIGWGGIVAMSRPDGNAWTVEATGFGSYPHSRIYRGDYVRYQVDPAQVVADVWSHIQERAPLGVQVVGDSTPVRLGEVGYVVRDGGRLNWVVPHKEWRQLAELGWAGGAVYAPTTPEELVRWLADYAGFGMAGWWMSRTGHQPEFSPDEDMLLDAGWSGGVLLQSQVSDAVWRRLTASGWWQKYGGPANEIWPPGQHEAMADGDQIVEPAPFRVKPWTATVAGKVIDDMAARAPFEWVERFLWDGETVTPQIVIGYPRIGRRRDDLLFELDVNVTGLGYEASLADDHANTAVATGAGSDGGMLRQEVTRDDGRLARDFVVADPDMTDASVLARVASTEARRRTSVGVKVTSLTLSDHPHAPMGSWSVGDDIRLRADLPYLGEVEQWLRVMSWTLRADGSAELTVERSDAFLYGDGS